MKILYVITKSNWGGAQKYVFDLATSQENAVVAFGGGGKLKEKLGNEGIKTIQIKNLDRDISIFRDLKVFFELYRIFRSEKPDVVHLNSSKIGALGSLCARLARIKKIIYTAHGWAFNEKRSYPVKYVILKISWLTAFLSTDIIVLSEKERKQTQKFLLISKKKIHLIQNGIKRHELYSRKEALDKLNLDPNKRYIGTISELHRNKGLETLLRSAPYIKADVIIIGAGEEEYRLKKMIQNLNLENRIHLLGAIEEAGKYLKALDVFTLTSVKEGLPYVLLEAGYAGVPVVASRVGGIPEIVLEGKTGLLSRPNQPKNVKDNIIKLLKDPEFAKELGQNAKKHIEENFTFEKMLQKTREVYLT